MPRRLLLLQKRNLSYFPQFKYLPKEIRDIIWIAALPDLRERVVRIRQAELLLTNGEWHAYQREHGLLEGLDQQGLDYQACLEEWALARPDEFQKQEKTRMIGTQTFSTPPPILFVCREAYETAYLLYKRKFSWPMTGFYFSPKTDVLYLRYKRFQVGQPIVDGRQTSEWRRHGNFLDFVWNPDYQIGDLSGIRNLALLVDRDAVFEFHIDSLASNRDLYNIHDLESAICQILYQFGGIEHLTIVAQDFAERLDDESDRVSYFVDPLDLRRAYNALRPDYHKEFKKGHRCHYHEGVKKEHECKHLLPELPIMNPEWAMLDMVKLESYRQGDQEEKPWYPFKLPVVEYKIAVTESQKEFVHWLYKVSAKPLPSALIYTGK